MRLLPMALIACLALAACQQSDGTAAQTPSSESASAAPAAATAPASAPASAPSSASPAATGAPSGKPGGQPREATFDNDLYMMNYSYPAEAGAIPRLKSWLDTDIETRKARLEGIAKEGRSAARKDGYPYRPYGLWIDWQVVTETPDWLSLSAEVSDYTGGAHPNHHFNATLWDKGANVRRDTMDMFTSAPALSRVLRADFCKALDRQRAKKRGEPVDPARSGMFDECIDPVENTVILGSSNRKAFDRIGILVAPYQAGPYAEGAYEVTLSVTNKVLDLVKPQYRRYFANGR